MVPGCFNNVSANISRNQNGGQADPDSCPGDRRRKVNRGFPESAFGQIDFRFQDLV